MIAKINIFAISRSYSSSRSRHNYRRRQQNGQRSVGRMRKAIHNIGRKADLEPTSKTRRAQAQTRIRLHPTGERNARTRGQASRIWKEAGRKVTCSIIITVIA